jgi:MFS family permease
MFIYSLDGTIVADLGPSIVNEFDSVPLLPWLSVGFMVGSIITVLPLGKLYGKYNAKWLYVISVVLFLASSALCGAAPTMSAMIVGRVFLGMAGNGIYFGILTLLSVNTTDKERPAYLSLVGFVWGLGTVLGPVVGGGFDKVNWRWAFYLNLSKSQPVQQNPASSDKIHSHWWHLCACISAPTSPFRPSSQRRNAKRSRQEL